MTSKHKFKPAARADIREKVELKLRARGAVGFHLLLIVAGFVLLLYHLSNVWESRFFGGAYRDSLLAFAFLGATGALHYIRYYFRHGKGRDNHERETETRIRRQLQQTAPEDAGEQEVLIRLQQGDKLKNRRLVWQHLTVFVSVISLMVLLPLSDMTLSELLNSPYWQSLGTFTVVWGIGLAAHVLRYVSAYRVSSGRREAKIEQQLARELRREKRQRQAPAATASSSLLADAATDGSAERSIEDLLRGQSSPQRASRQ